MVCMWYWCMVCRIPNFDLSQSMRLQAVANMKCHIWLPNSWLLELCSCYHGIRIDMHRSWPRNLRCCLIWMKEIFDKMSLVLMISKKLGFFEWNVICFRKYTRPLLSTQTVYKNMNFRFYQLQSTQLPSQNIFYGLKMYQTVTMR